MQKNTTEDLRIKRLKEIKEKWKHTRGKKELVAHLAAERLTRGQAIVAKCYECTGGYDDTTKRDCKMPLCPLYQYMPFKES